MNYLQIKFTQKLFVIRFPHAVLWVIVFYLESKGSLIHQTEHHRRQQSFAQNLDCEQSLFLWIKDLVRLAHALHLVTSTCPQFPPARTSHLLTRSLIKRNRDCLQSTQNLAYSNVGEIPSSVLKTVVNLKRGNTIESKAKQRENKDWNKMKKRKKNITSRAPLKFCQAFICQSLLFKVNSTWNIQVPMQNVDSCKKKDKFASSD